MSPVERRLPWILVVGACVATLACGTLDSPTEPKPNPSANSAGGSTDSGGGNAGLVLGAPAPAASPSPSASPSPDAGQPSPSPSPGSGEAAADCGQPLPPAISTIGVKVHIKGSEAWILDSTPLVGPDAQYCKTIGFTDGRSVCPVRPEGNPQRTACELYAVGRAKDTNKPGPTWYFNGSFCRGKASGCENSGDNQYQLYAYASGPYKACSASGVCGELDVVR